MVVWDDVYGFKMNTIKQIALFEPLVDIVPETQPITDSYCIFVAIFESFRRVGFGYQHGEEGGLGFHVSVRAEREILRVHARFRGVLRHHFPWRRAVQYVSVQQRDALEADGVLFQGEDVVLRWRCGQGHAELQSREGKSARFGHCDRLGAAPEGKRDQGESEISNSMVCLLE